MRSYATVVCVFMEFLAVRCSWCEGSRALPSPQKEDRQSHHNEHQTGYDGDLMHRNGEMSPAFLQKITQDDEAHTPKESSRIRKQPKNSHMESA